MPHVPSKTRKKIEWLFLRAEGMFLPEPCLRHEGAHLDPIAARAKLAESTADLALTGNTERFDQLTRALDAGDAASITAYAERHGVVGVRRFRPARGTRIYGMSVETFPRHINNVYVIVDPGSVVMVDCGSGLDTSRRDMALGFAVIRAMFHEDVHYEQLDWCVISHAHMDHFGGANLLSKESRAHLAVHELDARVLACFDERLIVASKDIDVFLRRAGVDDDDRRGLLELYAAAKGRFTPQRVDRALRDGDVIGPGYRVHHVPGHCPGQICVQVHDVLLTSDHVLARITPHQFPEAITPFGGLEHYFRSLAKVRRIEGINFALGGHEEPIWDFRARVDSIAQFHLDRLAKVLAVCATPHTVVGVAKDMFGAQEGYGTLLAIEEAGAHVEYLHQHGKLRIANLEAVASSRNPVIEYVTS